LFLWLIFGLYRLYETKILGFSGQLASQIPTGPAAVKIVIPKVKLDLPVTEATVTDGTWEISPDGASHWDSSANPGADGNIVIYGHNKTNLFGPIRWLNLGDQIIITAADGSKHLYSITKTVTVSPKQIEYILPKDEETITLYTCTGLFDSQRYLVIAKPI
jgi:sortase A